MESYMFDLLAQMDIDEVVEMSRELRELSEMSPSERGIYALINPDAEVFTVCDKEVITCSREEILMVLN
jgi:hypothetical protein|tara:strand:- start:10 stop:216 length:207 start_codon:yes stop_codon:yes gene_type:complete